MDNSWIVLKLRIGLGRFHTIFFVFSVVVITVVFFVFAVQTDIHTDTHANRQASYIQTDIHTDRPPDKLTYIHSYRQAITLAPRHALCVLQLHNADASRV
mgnify:CR=1 FL=1